MTANSSLLGTYPTNDSFDAGPTTLDSGQLSGFYSRFEPWGANLMFGANTFWQFTTGNQIYALSGADIHNGFFGTVGTGTGASYLPAGPVAATASNVYTNGALCGFQYRDHSVADVDVRASFRFSQRESATQSTVAAGRFGFAVAARLNGTILNSGTANTRMGSINGYIFGLFGGAGTGGTVLDVRYLLIKVSGGTPTVVANSIGFGTTAPLFPAGTNPDRVLKLTCVTSGGNVVLTGYTIAADGTATQVVTYTDSSSPITAAGRTGFILSVENSSHTTPSGPMCHLCNWFEARPNGGSVVLRDQWERFLPMGGAIRSTIPTSVIFQHSLTKHSMMNGWVGDRNSYNSTGSQGYEGSLVPDSANNRIKGASFGNLQQVYSFSQRIATDAQFHDRQASITFENAGSTVARQAGVMVYGTPGTSDYTQALYKIPKCYLLQVVYNSGGTFELKLYRVRGDIPGFTLLATKTGLAGLALGTAFTLRLSAQTLTVPTPETGYVALKCYIGATQQTWDAAAGLYSQFEIQADGTVVDRGTNRIYSGLGQGIQFSSANVATANMFFDSWAAAAGDAAYTEPGQDQATIAVAAEDDAASGTFTVPYDWGSSEESLWTVNDHRFDSEHRYVGLVQLRTRTTYTIGNNAATSSEITTLKAFYTSHRGVQIPFSWTNPKGTSVTVRFTNDTLAIEQVTPSVYRWSCTLEEVLSE